MTDLKGKVAIVTGASRGIGRAIAQRLGREGASVVVNYANSPEKAEEVVKTIEAAGAKAIAVQADVSKIDDIYRLFDTTFAQFGQLDLLVNNAALSLHKSLAETTDEEFDRMFAINAKGTFVSLREAAKRMADNGRIVSITTPGTVMGWPGFGVYGASKATVVGYSIALAKELGSRGITVNMVMPGGTDTDGFAASAPPEMREQVAKSSPLGRMGQPEDIADVVAFLCSDRGRWITGQHLRATGGSV
jgi:3-oxoacyl-[acyl-carrier protein] reductase